MSDWIRVKDREPDPREYDVIWVFDNDTGIISRCPIYYLEKVLFFPGQTHWMPYRIPDPPTREEREG